jgi:hypothetical protein
MHQSFRFGKPEADQRDRSDIAFAKYAPTDGSLPQEIRAYNDWVTAPKGLHCHRQTLATPE